MKKRLSVILVVLLIFTVFSSIAFANNDKDTEEKIVIVLNEDNQAIVLNGNEYFEIDYKMHNEGVLVGNGENNGVLALLKFASKITGNKYELSIKNKISSSIFNYIGEYDVAITEYKNKTELSNMEFYPATIRRTDGSVFGTYDDIPAPHLLNDDEGNPKYYLPLRFMFEELGFEVEYINEIETVIISK